MFVYAYVQAYVYTYEFPTCCYTDINECTDLRTCGYNQKCINIAGSYECECITGYKPDPSSLISVGTYYHCTGTYINVHLLSTYVYAYVVT